MMKQIRPLPATIALMGMLTAVKMAGLVQAVGVGSPAHASTSAHAPEAKPAQKPAAPPQSERKPVQAEPPPPAAPPEPQISEAERNALQDLRARRAQLDAQSAKLDEREAIVAASLLRLNERVQQLSALQAKLEQLDKERRDREEANWRGLVKTYEAMRPKDAATIFNDLDNAVLIPVLDRMKEAKTAPILAAMAPERARAVTTQLSQYRNKVSAAPSVNSAQVAHQ